jgi:methylenetetrahydrofolate dehydrogenase (NADP+) / methenyltetrahydrofolate cyclohydrolase
MILKGKPVAREIEKNLPILANSGALLVVQVGSNTISDLYVRKKRELCEELGVSFKLKKFINSVSTKEVVDFIKQGNEDESTGGIIVQIPLPQNLDKERIIQAISCEKDIDGFCYIAGRDYKYYPPTVLAVDRIVEYYRPQAKRKKILIVGGGFLVGRPLYKYWHKAGLDVDILEKDCDQYFEKIKRADLIVVSTGGGAKLDKGHFKAGAVVVDASTISEAGKIAGDVDGKDWPDDIDLAPVPGGVGPLTVAMLLQNLLS